TSTGARSGYLSASDTDLRRTSRCSRRWVDAADARRDHCVAWWQSHSRRRKAHRSHWGERWHGCTGPPSLLGRRRCCKIIILLGGALTVRPAFSPFEDL